MKIKDLGWRALSAFDLGAVEAIAGTVHPNFFEASEVLSERQALYPAGAYLLEIGERPAGYVLSHPWRHGSLPALNSLLGTLPDDADTYYVHDLALLPLARRLGAAGAIVASLEKHARAQGFATMSLVAVNGSRGFWGRQGFGVEEVPELYGKLLSYEADARFMVKRLG